MPVLKRVSSRQTINPGQTPTVSADAEAVRMDAVAGFGKDVMKASNSIMEYQAIKAKADANATNADYTSRSKTVDNAAMQGALTSGELAEDGSNLDEIYQKGYEPIIGEAAKIKDPNLRQVAVSSIQKQMLSGLQETQKKKVALHNSFHNSMTDKILRTNSDLTIRDPYQYASAVQGMEEYIKNSPLGFEDKLKASEAMRKELSTSAIQGFIEQRNFSGARKAADVGGILSGDLDVEERKKLLREIDKAETTFMKDFDTKDQKDRVRKNIEVQASKINAYSEMLTANILQDPVKQELTLKRARGLVELGVIKESHVVALSIKDDDVDFDVSEETFGKFKKRLESGSRNQGFIDDVMDAVADKRMQPTVASDLLGDYNKFYVESFGASSASKVKYSERRTVSNQLLVDAFPANKFQDSIDIDGKLAVKKKQKVSAIRELSLKYRSENMDPVSAMKRAIKEIDPTNPVFSPPPQIKPKEQLQKDVSNAIEEGDHQALNAMLRQAIDAKKKQEMQSALKDGGK